MNSSRTVPKSLRVLALSIFAAAALAASPERAGAQSFGIAGILNPEGTRLFPQSIIFPRHPGKPDLRWKDFDWRYTDVKVEKSEFRLYFYKEEQWTAEFAIPRIREQIQALSNEFHFAPKQTFSYLVFSSQREFQQAHIFDISEGVQGITSTEEATMAIPYWGEFETFRHISTHELVHQFQVQRINELSNGAPEGAYMVLPLWYVEGMAEYFSLRGMDTEARSYIRDMAINPDPEKDYKIYPFFEEGPMDFMHVYKEGQTRFDFLETQFGKGASIKLFESIAKPPKNARPVFKDAAAAALGVPADQIEKRWNEYIEKKYKADAKRLTEDFDNIELVKEAGDTLDSYDISPDGSVVAIREIDPLPGTTSISLIDLKRKNQKINVATDNKPDLLTLHFMQFPILAMGSKHVAYVVSTTSGPEIEIRELSRNGNGDLRVDGKRRIQLHKLGLLQASSPAFSPDETHIAFVGLNPQGRQNLYVLDLNKSDDGNPAPRQLTNGYYAWKSIEWTKDGLLVSSDRTSSSRYAVFLVSPDSGEARIIDSSPVDLSSPSGTVDHFVFGAASSGVFQLIQHTRDTNGSHDRAITDIKTSIASPKLRGADVYGIGFKGGRYHLYRIKPEKRLDKPFEPVPDVPQTQGAPSPAAGTASAKMTVTSGTLPNQQQRVQTLPGAPDPLELTPWVVPLDQLTPDRIKVYHPFTGPGGMRLDGIGGFLSTGGFGGISGQVSDLMRNYTVSTELFVLGDIKLTNASTFFTSTAGRTSWTIGAYHIVQSRLDSIFDNFNTYIQREYGLLGALQYPLAAFSYVDLELRLAGVKRSDYSDATLAPAWDAQNPGSEFLLSPVMRIGYDRVLYEMFTGPLSGYGLLLEGETSVFPRRRDVSERIRLDAAYYLQAIGRTVIAFQGLSGFSWGGKYPNPFFLSSDDILRGYPFFDDRLRGSYLLAGKVELRYPIGSLFRFQPLRGLLAYDIGTVTHTLQQAGHDLASSYTGGLSLNLPPIAVNFLLSYPITLAPGPMDRPVFHFTLRYLYL